MKKYSKPQMMAKNAPTGSYAAGCGATKSYTPANPTACKVCEMVK